MVSCYSLNYFKDQLEINTKYANNKKEIELYNLFTSIIFLPNVLGHLIQEYDRQISILDYKILSEVKFRSSVRSSAIALGCIFQVQSTIKHQNENMMTMFALRALSFWNSTTTGAEIDTNQLMNSHEQEIKLHLSLSHPSLVNAHYLFSNPFEPIFRSLSLDEKINCQSYKLQNLIIYDWCGKGSL